MEDQPDNLEQGMIYYKKGDFLVLVSDGLYSSVTNGAVGDAVRKLSAAGVPTQEIATLIANKAGSEEGNDNVTVMIVPL
jgi:serine/threonine protein phosphatase PrpC